MPITECPFVYVPDPGASLSMGYKKKEAASTATIGRLVNYVRSSVMKPILKGYQFVLQEKINVNVHLPASWSASKREQARSCPWREELEIWDLGGGGACRYIRWILWFPEPRVGWNKEIQVLSSGPPYSPTTSTHRNIRPYFQWTILEILNRNKQALTETAESLTTRLSDETEQFKYYVLGLLTRRPLQRTRSGPSPIAY